MQTMQTTSWGMEYAVLDVPKAHMREIKTVFPGLDSYDDLRIVPTCQHSSANLLDTGPAVDSEKDALLERFAAWAQAVCGQLSAQGHWCDYIDPCSGLPMVHTQYQQVFSEVDSFSVLLQFPVHLAGNCRVILHPKWGGNVYPATLFARAPAAAVQAAIDAADSNATAAQA